MERRVFLRPAAAGRRAISTLKAQVGATAATATAWFPGLALGWHLAAPPAAWNWIGPAPSPTGSSDYQRLANGPWVDVSLPPGTHGLTVTPTDQQAFYRLVPP